MLIAQALQGNTRKLCPHYLNSRRRGEEYMAPSARQAQVSRSSTCLNLKSLPALHLNQKPTNMKRTQAPAVQSKSAKHAVCREEPNVGCRAPRDAVQKNSA